MPFPGNSASEDGNSSAWFHARWLIGIGAGISEETGLGNRHRGANIEIGPCLSRVKSKGNLVSVNWLTKYVEFSTQLKYSHHSVFAIPLHYHEFSLKIFPRRIFASFPQLCCLSSTRSTSESTSVITTLFVVPTTSPESYHSLLLPIHPSIR